MKFKKGEKVVLGEGGFGFTDLGQSIELWNKTNSHRKAFHIARLRSLEPLRVRIIAEVLEVPPLDKEDGR